MEETTTTEDSFFGSMFEYNYDTENVQKFPTIETLLDAVDFDIGKMVLSFKFGNYDIITTDAKYRSEIKEWLRSNWEAKLDPNLGFCYFYDQKERS